MARMTDHDSFYYRLFNHAGMVARLLREFVPEPWLDDFDLDNITRETDKFHTDYDERRHSDTAWRIPKRGGTVYVLVIVGVSVNHRPMDGAPRAGLCRLAVAAFD
jgi:hypothetical protein